MYKLLIALTVFLLAIMIPVFISNNGPLEGFFGSSKKKRNKKRRDRAAKRRKWFAWVGDASYNKSKGGYKGYLNDLPVGYRDGYDADRNDDIVNFHKHAGCYNNQHSKLCASSGDSQYWKPIRAKILADAEKIFISKRDSDGYDDLIGIFEMNHNEKHQEEKRQYLPTVYEFKNETLWEKARQELYNVDTPTYKKALNNAYAIMIAQTNNDYLNARKESNKNATNGVVTTGTDVISGFDTLGDKVKYIDPNKRNVITDESIWENVRSEIMSDPVKKSKYDKLNDSIIDSTTGEIIYTSDEFLNTYNETYKSHSAPIEYILEDSSQESIKIRAALYPSRQLKTSEGMSNLMKEGMNLKNSTKHTCSVNEKCKVGQSSYPGIYK